jgi:hypothetical protein
MGPFSAEAGADRGAFANDSVHTQPRLRDIATQDMIMTVRV